MQENTKEIVSSLRVFKKELIITKKVNGLPLEFDVVSDNGVRQFVVMNDLIKLGLENKHSFFIWLQQELKQILKS